MQVNYPFQDLDPVTRLRSPNRDLEIPDDILIPTSQNVVDRGRQLTRGPFTSGKVMASPPNQAHSVLKTVQRAIDEERLSVKAAAVNDYILLYDQDNTRVLAKYFNVIPSVQVGNGVVLVTAPENCILDGFIITGDTATLLNNNRVFTFTGAGVPGNTDLNNIVVPSIQKVSGTPSFGIPSLDNPWTIDLDNSPSAQMVGLGTSGNPSISIRLNNLNSFSYHIITFNW